MNAGIRYIFSAVLAVFVTLGAFFFMYKLIEGGGQRPENSEDSPSISFRDVQIPDTMEQKIRKKPPPPPPPEEPPPPPKMQIDQPQQVMQNVPQLDIPSLDVPFGGTGGPFLGGFAKVDQNAEGDIIPLVRIQPQYPREAQIRGLEGYVTVEFTILPSGGVANPRVVDSKPSRVFDREAIRAILKWKFKPRVIDGVAVERQAQQTIDFNLPD